MDTKFIGTEAVSLGGLKAILWNIATNGKKHNITFARSLTGFISQYRALKRDNKANLLIILFYL
jgi:hypothetical protein